jgi:hypothetical protein
MVAQASIAPGMLTACADVSGIARRVGSPRRAAGTVIGCYLALALGLKQREAIPADPGGLRLDHAEQRTGRHGGVGCSAAGTQHLDRRQRRQRMRRRHHRILGVDRRPAGEMEIPHAK